MRIPKVGAFPSDFMGDDETGGRESPSLKLKLTGGKIIR